MTHALKLIVMLSLFSFSIAKADSGQIVLRCSANNVQECELRAHTAFVKLSCEPLNTKCEINNEVDGEGNKTGEMVYCNVVSEKCAEPTPLLFGGVSCPQNLSKKSLRSVDSMLTLSYMTGLFQLWVRTICTSN